MRDGSRVHREPIDQLGTQLCPGSIANGYAADLHRGLPTGTPGRLRSRPSTWNSRALHPGPYPPDLSRCHAYGAFNTGFSRIPSDLARRTQPVWQYQAVSALSALLPILPGTSRIGLRSAPTKLLRQPGGKDSHLLGSSAPHGAPAPHGAHRASGFSPHLGSSKPRGRCGLGHRIPAVSAGDPGESCYDVEAQPGGDGGSCETVHRSLTGPQRPPGTLSSPAPHRCPGERPRGGTPPDTRHGPDRPGPRPAPSAAFSLQTLRSLQQVGGDMWRMINKMGGRPGKGSIGPTQSG
jgi:hypothetical protein